MIEEHFQEYAAIIALAIEGIVVLVLAYAALEAVANTVRAIGAGPDVERRRETWFRFALWIILALEFALAADIIRSAIAPSWDSIGQLAAIAAIRTFLNWFLVKDIESYNEKRKSKEAGSDG
ncbi:DUF1622 domain-containing protein [Sandaracinobacter sp.]|jgi:uncharacterized membrane protein|uniref:DUF1622 domain-containing protein n=1 Tax=Sandaracinobacter sp. TaxID=2487581 RepID=UPI0035B41163